jgi:Icc-related predicted phosphoesterase
MSCSRILPSVLPPVSRIIAIGDVHGDFRALLKCLRLAKVIDHNRKWVGGDTVVVQLGDQVDSKCRSGQCEIDEIGDELKILKFLDKLHIEAKRSSGAVYSLLGNHELMNVMGNLNYTSAENLIGFGGAKGRINKFAPSGEIAIYLACNRNSIMKIGDYIFVHGGLLPRKAKQYSLEKINSIIREYLLGNKSKDDKEVKDLLTGNESPFWSRLFSNAFTGNSAGTCKTLDETIEYLKVKGMVVGHTVQKQGINSGCNGKIWRTDVGLSRSFGKSKRSIQVLEILGNGATVNVLS